MPLRRLGAILMRAQIRMPLGMQSVRYGLGRLQAEIKTLGIRAHPHYVLSTNTPAFHQCLETLWEAEFKSFFYLVGKCQGSAAFLLWCGYCWLLFTKVYNVNWGPKNNSERAVIFIAVWRKNTVKAIKHS